MNRGRPFGQTGWGIRVWNDPNGFEEAVDRAIQEADAYGVDLLDLHDGVIPPAVGWVSLFAQYRHAQSLRRYDSFTYRGRELSHENRDEYRQWFRDICARIRDAGLGVHVWYHVLDNLPEELLSAESTISRWDGRRLWQTVGGQLDDFFTAVPEVDTICVTATQVLANSLNDPSGVSPSEKLRAIYQCAYEACRRSRRKLIIREIGYTAREHEAFFDAVEPLPPDIPILVKDTQDDWCHVDAPVNPSLYRLRGKNIVVECDLYGEHWGKQDVPMCRLQQIHRTIRAWLPLNVQGAVGRIMVRQSENTEMVHVFDTPNSANVHAFSSLMQDPGPRLEDVQELDMDTEAFDARLWFTLALDRVRRVGQPLHRVRAGQDAEDRTARLLSGRLLLPVGELPSGTKRL